MHKRCYTAAPPVRQRKITLKFVFSLNTLIWNSNAIITYYSLQCPLCVIYAYITKNINKIHNNKNNNNYKQVKLPKKQFHYWYTFLFCRFCFICRKQVKLTLPKMQFHFIRLFYFSDFCFICMKQVKVTLLQMQFNQFSCYSFSLFYFFLFFSYLQKQINSALHAVRSFRLYFSVLLFFLFFFIWKQKQVNWHCHKSSSVLYGTWI